MNESNITNKRSYDYLGVILSTLCGVHCLVTPLLILYLPVVGHSMQSPWFHTAMILFVAFTFHQSIYKHFKIHKSKLTLGLGLSGLVFFAIGYLNELMHHSEEHGNRYGHHEVHNDETAMIYLAIIGAVLLISAHILNIRKCKCLKGQGLCTK